MASSYFNNLLTQTTSHYKSIRRTLLSNEEDGDTEDDSHITRVLRAYYTEKGRTFPPWLPPDPNEKAKSTNPQSSYTQYTQPIAGYFNNVTGRNQPPPQMQAQPPSSNRSSLSDLWDAPNAVQQPMQPQSLRNARKPAPAPAPMASNLAPPQARPLPSQREGSYQNMYSNAPSRPSFEPMPSSSSGGGGGTAQDRLKARLYGGRSGSPGNAAPYQPPSGGGYGR